LSNVFNKLRNFVGLNEPDEFEEYYDEEEMETPSYESQEMTSPVASEPQSRSRPTQPPNRFSREGQGAASSSAGSNVIGMPGANNGLSEIIVFEPYSFEKMPEVIEALRERKTVVLNLNMMEPDDAQRAVDFVAGGTYAIDGHQERVGESIFLFTPNSVNVTTRSHANPGLSNSPTSETENVYEMASAGEDWEEADEAIAQ